MTPDEMHDLRSRQLKYYHRRREAKLCGYSGCPNTPEIKPNGRQFYACNIHREFWAKYSKLRGAK